MSIESNPSAADFARASPPPHMRQSQQSSRARAQRQRGLARASSSSTIDSLVKGLGWFSIALGAAELLAPRAVNRVSGLEANHVGLTRLFGLRELGGGIGIL